MADLTGLTESESTISVKVFSPGGHFLGTVVHDLAVRAIREKHAEIRSRNRKRLLQIVDLSARVEARIPGGKPTVYREKLIDTFSVYVPFRFDKARKAVAWDPNLTFDELRAGKLLSAVTIAARAEDRAFRTLTDYHG